MNKLGWFGFGMTVGSCGLYIYEHGFDNFKEKLGLVSPSKPFLGDGNDNSVDTNNDGGVFDRARAEFDRLSLSKFVHDKGYAASDDDGTEKSSSNEEEASEPVFMVNGEDKHLVNIVNVDKSLVTLDPAVVGETVIPPDVKLNLEEMIEMDRRKFIPISKEEFVTQKNAGHSVMTFVYDTVLYLFSDVHTGKEYDEREIRDFIGAGLAHSIVKNGSNNEWIETEYLYNTKDDLYICIKDATEQ